MKNHWKTASLFLAIVPLILALMGLAGYLPGLKLLASINESYIPMAPSTAGCFIITAATLMLLRIIEFSSNVRKLMMALNVFVLVFGLLEVIGHYTGADLNLEETLVPAMGTLDGIPIARMSHSTGIMFVFTGLSMVFAIIKSSQKVTRRGIEIVISSLGIIIFLTGFIFFLAYLYGSPMMYRYATTIPMALTTSLGFVFASASLLTYFYGIYPFSLFSSTSTKSYLLEYFLPLTIVSVFAGELLTAGSIRILNVNPAIVAASTTIIFMVITMFIVSMISRHIGKTIDRQKQTILDAQAALTGSEEKYRNLFLNKSLGVIYQDVDGRIISANPAAERILGLTFDQLKSIKSVHPTWKIINKDNEELFEDDFPAMIALQTGKPVHGFVQGIYKPENGDYVWLLVDSIPQFKDNQTEPDLVFSTFMDISTRENTRRQLNELKDNLAKEVEEKTRELKQRVAELEHFADVTIEREIRMKELTGEIEKLKKNIQDA